MSELLNVEVITALILLGAALVRLTAWGKANQEALNTVVWEVERHRADAVKRGVALHEEDLGDAARDALQLAVRNVDVRKEAASLTEKAMRVVVPRVVRRIPSVITGIFR